MLEREMRHATNACFKCGEFGHWARECRQQPPVIMPDCFIVNKIPLPTPNPFTAAAVATPPTLSIGHYHSARSPDDDDDFDVCFRCGYPGHWAYQCYAKFDIDGHRIEPDGDDENN